MIQDWFKNNLWNLMITAVFIVMAWSLAMSRISAIEERNAKVDPLVERFLVSEQDVKNTQEDIKEIKDHLKIINEKQDIIIQQHFEVQSELKRLK